MATSARWQDRGACRTADLMLFFGPDGEAAEARLKREAKAGVICAECPVRPACLDHAVTKPEQRGVWGAAGEDERAAMRRRRLRAQRREAA